MSFVYELANNIDNLIGGLFGVLDENANEEINVPNNLLHLDEISTLKEDILSLEKVGNQSDDESKELITKALGKKWERINTLVETDKVMIDHWKRIMNKRRTLQYRIHETNKIFLKLENYMSSSGLRRCDVEKIQNAVIQFYEECVQDLIALDAIDISKTPALREHRKQTIKQIDTFIGGTLNKLKEHIKSFQQFLEFVTEHVE